VTGRALTALQRGRAELQGSHCALRAYLREGHGGRAEELGEHGIKCQLFDFDVPSHVAIVASAVLDCTFNCCDFGHDVGSD
jgi:hypothetical protein